MIDGLFVIALIGIAGYLFDENQKLKKRINHIVNERKGECYDER